MLLDYGIIDFVNLHHLKFERDDWLLEDLLIIAGMLRQVLDPSEGQMHCDVIVLNWNDV